MGVGGRVNGRKGSSLIERTDSTTHANLNFLRTRDHLGPVGPAVIHPHASRALGLDDLEADKLLISARRESDLHMVRRRTGRDGHHASRGCRDRHRSPTR